MGAWGHGSFDNDTALDWASALLDSEGLEVIEDALVAVSELADGEYLDADFGSEALASAEVLAALLDRPGELPDEVKTWISKHRDLDAHSLVGVALEVLARLIAEGSELRELWRESEHFDDWLENVSDLSARLTP